MPDTVNVPLLGGIPKRGLLIGGAIGLGVVGYVLWQKHKSAQGATGAATGYGATGYGYGTGTQGYYGYGYAYGAYGSGAFNPYPSGEAYGYGAYGYGMYNPYTGQYYGSGTGSPSTPPAWWNIAPSWWKPPKTSGTGKAGTSKITSQGNMDLNRIARLEGISVERLIDLNPHLKHYQGTGKHIPRGLRIRV